MDLINMDIALPEGYPILEKMLFSIVVESEKEKR
jgi:hypothetical protein